MNDRMYLLKEVRTCNALDSLWWHVFQDIFWPKVLNLKSRICSKRVGRKRSLQTATCILAGCRANWTETWNDNQNHLGAFSACTSSICFEERAKSYKSVYIIACVCPCMDSYCTDWLEWKVNLCMESLKEQWGQTWKDVTPAFGLRYWDYCNELVVFGYRKSSTYSMKGIKEVPMICQQETNTYLQTVDGLQTNVQRSKELCKFFTSRKLVVIIKYQCREAQQLSFV